MEDTATWLGLARCLNKESNAYPIKNTLDTLDLMKNLTCLPKNLPSAAPLNGSWIFRAIP